VPDWRSPGWGLYSRISAAAAARGDADVAACPGLVFSLSHFRRDPRAFYRTVREHCLWPGMRMRRGGASTRRRDEEEEEDGGDGGDGQAGNDGATAGDQQQEQGQQKQGKKKANSNKKTKAAAEEEDEQQQQQPVAVADLAGLPPTAAHHLLAAMEERGMLLRAYTQNVDGLEHAAGLPDDRVVQAHGGFRAAHCAACGAEASPYAVMAALLGGGEEEEGEEEEGGQAEPEPPLCPSCNERAVKPDVVLFGERLPARFHRLRLQDMPRCELLLVLGTAMAVEPFASLLRAPPSPLCARVLVNRDPVREDELDCFGGGRAGRWRDAAVLGECDDGCLALAEALGGKEMRREVELRWRGCGGGPAEGGRR
jgi:NAD-dependent SIR2 family protein deacetylase